MDKKRMEELAEGMDSDKLWADVQKRAQYEAGALITKTAAFLAPKLREAAFKANKSKDAEAETFQRAMEMVIEALDGEVIEVPLGPGAMLKLKIDAEMVEA